MASVTPLAPSVISTDASTNGTIVACAVTVGTLTLLFLLLLLFPLLLLLLFLATKSLLPS